MGSLFLLPNGSKRHGGGQRFPHDGITFVTLSRWATINRSEWIPDVERASNKCYILEQPAGAAAAVWTSRVDMGANFYRKHLAEHGLYLVASALNTSTTRTTTTTTMGSITTKYLRHLMLPSHSRKVDKRYIINKSPSSRTRFVSFASQCGDDTEEPVELMCLPLWLECQSDVNGAVAQASQLVS